MINIYIFINIKYLDATWYTMYTMVCLIPFCRHEALSMHSDYLKPLWTSDAFSRRVMFIEMSAGDGVGKWYNAPWSKGQSNKDFYMLSPLWQNRNIIQQSSYIKWYLVANISKFRINGALYSLIIHWHLSSWNAGSLDKWTRRFWNASPRCGRSPVARGAPDLKTGKNNIDIENFSNFKCCDMESWHAVWHIHTLDFVTFDVFFDVTCIPLYSHFAVRHLKFGISKSSSIAAEEPPKLTVPSMWPCLERRQPLCVLKSIHEWMCSHVKLTMVVYYTTSTALSMEPVSLCCPHELLKFRKKYRKTFPLMKKYGGDKVQGVADIEKLCSSLLPTAPSQRAAKLRSRHQCRCMIWSSNHVMATNFQTGWTWMNPS